MTENVSPEMVSDLIELAHDMVSADRFAVEGLALRAAVIVDRLPVPVDPDLLEAREIASAVMSDGQDGGAFDRQMRAGRWDDSAAVRAALAAIKRGRTLATQGDR